MKPQTKVATLDPDQLLEALDSMRAADADPEQRQAIVVDLFADSRQHDTLEGALDDALGSRRGRPSTTASWRPATWGERLLAWARRVLR